MPKTALGLIIGNAAYPKGALKNSVNDAIDFSEKLKNLGFFIKTLTDVTFEVLDNAVDTFAAELNNYDVGIFYFAGHGIQVDGINYITAINTKFDSQVSVKHSSLSLDKLLDLMKNAANDTNIIILDACRENPYETSWHRSIKQRGLAPIHAPKGTLIAFATSPGEMASDGKGKNGLYTSALLKHIEDEDLLVEELFKRVRNTVSSASKGKQTTWEHTSLTGTFIFNPGHFVSAVSDKYSHDVIADKKFPESEDTLGGKIITKLRSHNYNTQNTGIGWLPSIDLKKETAETLFVIGRNILQSACGGSFSAQSFVRNIQSASMYAYKGENHIVNGILFEIYFNHEGKFRYNEFKTCFLEEIFQIQKDKSFKSCISFIQDVLKPFKEHLLVLPSPKPQKIALDIYTEKAEISSARKKETNVLKSITYESKNLFHSDTEWDDPDDDYSPPSYTYGKLKQEISHSIVVPMSQIVFNSNDELSDNAKIITPFLYKIAF